MDMANTSIDDDNEGVPGPGFEPGAEHLEGVRAPDIEDEGEAAPDDLRSVGEDGHAIGPEPEMIVFEKQYRIRACQLKLHIQ